MAAVTVVYFVRDLPRRLLEAELAHQLEATVSLGGWEMVSRDSWALYDLKIRLDHLPVALVLDVPIVHIEGRAEDIADGSIRSLRLERSILSLELPQQTTPPAAEPSPPTEPPLIDDLQIPGMRIRLCAKVVDFVCQDPVSDSDLQLDAHFRDLGRQAEGTMALKAQSLDIHTASAGGESPHLQTELTQLILEAELRRGLWTLGAAADEVRASTPEMELRFSDLSWRGTAGTESAQGFTANTLDASLGSALMTFDQQSIHLPEIRWQALSSSDSADGNPPAASQTATLELAMESKLWQSGLIRGTAEDEGRRSLSLELTKVDLGTLLRLNPMQLEAPSVPAVEGTADLDLRLAQDANAPLRWQLGVEMWPRSLRLSSPEPLHLGFDPSTSIQLRTEGQGLTPDSLVAKVEGSAQLPGIRSIGADDDPFSPIPAGTWPVRLHWRAELVPGEPAELASGELNVEHWRIQTQLATCRGSGTIKGSTTTAPGSRGSDEPVIQTRWQCSGQLRPVVAELGPSLPLPDASSTWKARGKARWQGVEWAGDGKLELSAATVSPTQGLGVSDLDLTTRAHINPKRLRLFETDLSMVVEALELAPLQSHSKGEATVFLDAPGDRMSWDLESLELKPLEVKPQSGLAVPQTTLGTIRSKGESRPGRLQATLQLEGLSPASWLTWLSPRLPDGVKSIDSKGELSFQGELTQDQDLWTLKGPWIGRGLGLASEDGSRVLEGLDFDSRLSAGMHPAEGAGNKLNVELDGQAGGFLMLWQTLFSDFTDLSTRYTLGASMDIGDVASIASSPISLAATVQPDQGPRLVLSSEVQPETGSGSFDLQFEAEDLQSLHHQFLTRLQEEPPTLSDLKGSAHLELRGSFQNAADGLEWDASGQLQLKDTRITSESMVLRDMDLSLPIDLQLARSKGQTIWQGEQRRGSFRLGRSTVGEIQLPAIESELDIRADSITLARPLEISLLGGTLEMSRLTLRDLAQPSRFAETALSLRGLSLEKITADSGLPMLDGQLDGELPKVSIAGQKLRVFGGGTLQLLGGEVEIRDISGSEVFTPFPKIRLSAEIRRLSLEQLTETFDFGRVTGLISGQIDDCELFRGVPTAFQASFRTVQEKGVTQTVDVKAVKNLTILGTGQGTNIFDQGIQRFLSSYRYSALGVDVTLNNDVLLLKGLERRGDRELFLKGGFPFGIDIVNARPGQTVSFQTMVGRLKSLDFDRATFSDK